jgi:endonuclease YncB( thermonuclease family)
MGAWCSTADTRTTKGVASCNATVAEVPSSALTLDTVVVDACPWFGFPSGCVIETKVINVYDGDTVTLIVPFETKFFKCKCRLMGIDTPELRTRDPREKAAGIAARDSLRSLIADKHVWVECGGYDKYGRLLGTIYLTAALEKPSVNEQMLLQGHAKSYFGGTKGAFGEDG